MSKPYLIDGIIGNSKILVSMGRNGEIYRLWWPTIDYPQHVKEMKYGLHVPGRTEYSSWIQYGEWQYQQKYIEDTNILETTSINPNLGFKVTAKDFAVPQRDILVRYFEIENISSEELPLIFLHYTALEIANSEFYNSVLFERTSEALVHYRHKYNFAIGSNIPTSGYQCGNHAWEDAQDGVLNGNLIGMSADGALSWNFGKIEPGKKVSIPLFICPGFSYELALESLALAKNLGYEKLYNDTISYWHNYLKKGRQVNTGIIDIDNLYRRSLLTFKLLSDENYGGIVAAPEFDEKFSRCGGYGFCWGRDAAYIVIAIDKAGYHELGEKFFEWAIRAQSNNGAWLQRHYMNGALAPSWGLQIDETGSIIWGMWQHYIITGNEKFLSYVWDSVLKAAQLLNSFIDNETNLPLPTYDLWEERMGEHTYSASAVYGGLTSAANIALQLGFDDLAARWNKKAAEIKDGLLANLWNPKRESFYRSIKKVVTRDEFAYLNNLGHRVSTRTNDKGYVTHMVWDDDEIDSSLLGVTVPFEVLPYNHEYVIKTVQAIDRHLRVPGVGGLKRYEHDNYIGGNPWIITTLWMALYNIKEKEFSKAKELLVWAVKHRTELNFLPEQINKDTGEIAWVVPLTWSHAMFVLVLLELIDEGINLS